ncbi:MAG: hypothetical protein FWD62_15455 [Betaproteobacteria bacterium]|nr:hypothetical protein [Betaproteobacteria bacterium]
MIAREPIYTALFERLRSIPGLVICSRRLRHWADVSAGEQPALFQAQKGETPQFETGQPGAWRLSLDLYLYVKAPTSEAPAQYLNPLLDAICAVFEPENPITNRCTLGGLVHYARIAGQIETDEGTLGDQAVAVVPIEILTTD